MVKRPLLGNPKFLHCEHARIYPFRCRVILLLVLFGLSNPIFAIPVFCQTSEQVLVYGKVVNALSREPINNATVILWDTSYYQRVETGRTDENGDFGFKLTHSEGHTYQIYVYHYLGERIYDYIPYRSSKFEPAVDEEEVSFQFQFQLHPGATIFLNGTILYIESPHGHPSESFWSTVLDPATLRPPQLGEGNIYTFGDTADNPFLGLEWSTVVIPAEMNVLVRTEARVPIETLGGFYQTIAFLIDNDGEGYKLSQGVVENVVLERYALESSVEAAESYVDEVWETLNEAEGKGFYVVAEREELTSARSLIVSAQNDLSAGSFTSSFDKLRRAYVNTLYRVKIRLENMKDVAQTGSVVQIPFFAAYSAALAFFLFDRDRQKLAAFLIIHAIATGIFFYVYPGNQLIPLSSFLLFSLSSVAAIGLIAFVLPRIIKESLLPTSSARFTAVVSVLFSVGKRNLRRRRLRALLVLASIIVPIFAFTSFTSISRVYAVIAENVSYSPRTDGILMKNIPSENLTAIPFLTMNPVDITWLKSKTGIQVIAPKVENQPNEDRLGAFATEKGEVSLYGVLGISPDAETHFTGFDELIVSGTYLSESDKNTILISRSSASQLGIDTGETVSLYVFREGKKIPYGTFTIAGIFDDGRLSDLRDLNGDPILPYKIVQQDSERQIVNCDPSEVVVMTWEEALQITPAIVVSRIAFTLDDMSNVDSLVESIIYTREYHVWISFEGRLIRRYLGLVNEIRGAEVVIPIAIAVFNITNIMIGVVDERKQEVYIYNTIGLNPTHITFLFIAEALVMGVVGGGLGYILGLLNYRVLTFMGGGGLSVRQKLEWYWSVAGLGVAVASAVLSTLGPAIKATLRVTPSLKVRHRMLERERKAREREIFKTYTREEVSIPVTIHERYTEFFFSYLTTRLKELEQGYTEKIENLTETEEETPAGEIVRRYKYSYVYGKNSSENEITVTKRPENDFWQITVSCKPNLGVPEEFVHHVIAFVLQF